MKITPIMAMLLAAAALAAILYARNANASTVVNGIDMGKPGGW